jgi:hypothetical protein
MKVAIGWIVQLDNQLIRTGTGYRSRTAKVYRSRGTAQGVATQYGGAPRAVVREAFTEIDTPEFPE